MLERRRRRAFAIEAPARQCDNHALALDQALGPVLGVAESRAGDRKAVDPRLELGRQREIVHRRSDHDGIGGKELVEHCRIRERVERQVRQRIGGEISIHDPFAPLGGLELVDDRTGECAAGALLAADAAVDMKDGHYCLLSMDLLLRHPK